MTTERTIILLGSLLLVPVACSGDDDATDVGDATSDADGSGTSTSSTGTTSSTTGSTGDSGETGESSGGGSTGATLDGSSGTTSDGSSDSSGTGASGLEIAGEWVDNFEQTHDITDDSWTQSSDFGTFVYTIDHYDNAERVVIAEDEMATWNKLEWTYDVDSALWYCQSAFGLETAEDAEASPDADTADPATGGCGGFAWSRLDPA